MTLSLLMQALMLATLVALVGVLAVDAVRSLSRSPARGARQTVNRADERRSASPAARGHRAARTSLQG